MIPDSLIGKRICTVWFMSKSWTTMLVVHQESRSRFTWNMLILRNEMIRLDGFFKRFSVKFVIYLARPPSLNLSSYHFDSFTLIQTQSVFHIYSSGSGVWTSEVRSWRSCQCRRCPRSVFYVRNVFCGPASAATSASSSCFTETDGSCQKFVLVESFCRRLDQAARARAEWKGE